MPERVMLRNPVYKLLPVARTGGSANAFATSVLQRKPNFWAMIVAGDARLPKACHDLLVNDFRKTFPTFVFESEHLSLAPEAFVALFARESVYSKLLEAIGGGEKPALYVDDLLKPLYGLFLGIYLCPDPDDASKDAVAIDGFKISPGTTNAGTAHIEQIPDKGIVVPRGFVRIKRDTIEIHINFLNNVDPDAVYIAALPRGDEVDALLTICLDIKYRSRLVIGRPTILFRTQELPETTRVYNDAPDLCSVVKDVLTKHMGPTTRWELAPKAEIDQDSQTAIRTALQALRRDISSPGEERSAD